LTDLIRSQPSDHHPKVVLAARSYTLVRSFSGSYVLTIYVQ